MSELVAPKDQRENAKFRRFILDKANGDRDLQHELWIRCSRDPVFWLDTFGYTFSPKEHSDNPDRLFILYPYQEQAFYSLNDGIGKADRLIEKSRDMGASWICLSVLTWRFLFRRGQTFLVTSRKEDLVDKRGDPDSLFWKVDYLINNLPFWMRPDIERVSLHFSNPSMNSVIDGESTNKDLSVGGRRTAIMLDEFAKVEEFGHRVLTGTRDTTNCRIFNSTPQGAAGAYFDIREKMKSQNPDSIIRMHWSQHPDKSAGLYTTYEGRDGGMVKIIDTSYSFPKNYQFIRDGKLRSPWYDHQCTRAAHPQEIAQELDIDYAGSGWQYFEPMVVRDMVQKHCVPPAVRGEVTPDERDETKPKWTEDKNGRLRLWATPDENGRIDDTEYVISCDIAMGTGGTMSSNSVATITRRRTGEKVGRWSHNKTEPRPFARIVVLLCRMFNNAYLIWERNGPGQQFSAEIVSLGYANIFYQDDDTAYETNRQRKPGWHSTKDTKQILLSQYREAVMTGRVQNPDEEAMLETLEYICSPTGDIIHSRARSSIDPTATGERHGDMVIADALSVRAMGEFSDILMSDEPTDYAPNTMGHRIRDRVRQSKTVNLY